MHAIVDGQVFKSEGATLRAFHCPGHTSNHMAFILEEEDAMFTGDNVLGHGTSVFEDLSTYLFSLGKMREQFTGRAYPGHGPVIEDGRAKITEYIEHRREREGQVVDVLQATEMGVSPMEIVKTVYKGYPANLFEPAARGVLQILKKLEGEGRVRDEGADRWQMTRKATL